MIRDEGLSIRDEGLSSQPEDCVSAARKASRFELLSSSIWSRLVSEVRSSLTEACDVRQDPLQLDIETLQR